MASLTTGRGLRRLGGWLCIVALLLASGAASALGLGEIRVKSLPGQPLLAEIPVISSDPAELQQLQARLASAATFERVGLSRPSGLVRELGFAVAQASDGTHYIRVTSATPVHEDAVNFLIEVDWGQGRLVREYSALVNAPGVIAAVAEPVIDVPAALPDDAIVREPEPVVQVEELPPPAASVPVPAAVPVPVQAAVPANRATAATTSTPVVSVTTQAGSIIAHVARGQTLSAIARELGGPHSLNQTMLALLRANPEAFINGNINLLRQGAILRMPAADELARISRAEANALVAGQVAEWRSLRRPVAQPVAADAAVAAPASGPAGKGDARLEIAPAALAGERAGTTSGQQAGGQGNMLDDQQTRQAVEDLASSRAEIEELRGQVAELEKIKAQQEKLIALKDSDLAAAQQRLSESQGATGAPPWLWAGLGLLLLGLLAAFLVLRRRAARPAPAPRSPRFDASALALATPVPEAREAASSPLEADAGALAGEPAPNEPALNAPVIEQSLPPDAPVAPAAAERRDIDAFRPAWHAEDPALSVSLPNASPAGRDRLDLAMAYLDIGDRITARNLLNEVLAGDDAEAREAAAELLRTLD